MCRSSLLNAVRKMIGTRDERGRVRMSEATSKPSIRGICTSSRTTAKTSWSTRRRAASPAAAARVGWDDLDPRRPQHLLHGEEIALVVVDDEDLRRDEFEADDACARP